MSLKSNGARHSCLAPVPGTIWLFCALVLLPARGFAEGVPYFPAAEKPAKQLFVGEQLTYRISYVGIPVGEAQSEIKEIVKMGGREAYHIVVRVKSYPLIDWVYKVRDEHHSFIDTKELYSLRYEKILREGRYRADEVMTYNQKDHVAYYYSRKNKSQKEMDIPKNTQDQLSCGYYFRTLDIKPNTSVFIPVNADEKNWDLQVKLQKVSPMRISGVGLFEAMSAEPVIKFQGIFVRRGKIQGWISMDERRIPLRMQVKIPVLGSVVAELKDYQPGR